MATSRLLGMMVVAVLLPSVVRSQDIPGAPQARSAPASPVLFRSRIRCGICYWELALAGHPGNPDQLALAGAAGAVPWLSRDGGRTWAAGMLTGVTYPYTGDPQLLVTQEGDLLLSALTPFDHPDGSLYSLALGGALYRGPITGSSFIGTPFKEPPPNLPADAFLAADFPKLARDAASNTIYISTFATVFADGAIEDALYVSRDGGGTFTEQQIPNASSAFYSMDTAPDGSLRALVVEHSGFPSEAIRVMRFDQTASTFSLSSPITRGLGAFVSRVSATGKRAWTVDVSPKIAVDRTLGGTHTGRIYVGWSYPQSALVDPSLPIPTYGSDFDIFLTYSDDDGDTWSSPIRVNDDTTTGDQVFPSMRLDSTGALHVAFLDRRASPGHDQLDVYYTVVRDGHVSRNVRVNAQHVRLPYGRRIFHPQRLIGDYLDMVVAYPDIAYVAHPCSGGRDVCLTKLDPRLVQP